MGKIWDLIVSVHDHCLSFFFTIFTDDWNASLDGKNALLRSLLKKTKRINMENGLRRLHKNTKCGNMEIGSGSRNDTLTPSTSSASVSQCFNSQINTSLDS